MQYTPRRDSPFMKYTLWRDPDKSKLVMACIIKKQGSRKSAFGA
jgi:hypothetical protein